jgi:hypothetical protein
VTRLWPKGEPIQIWGDSDAPTGFIWQGTPHRIEEVCNRWQVHTRWWEPDQALWREYWKVTTDQWFLCLLYRDLIGGGWFLSRLYD